MTKKEIQKQRFRIRELLRQFRDKCFDGRKLVDEYYRLNILFKNTGGTPGSPAIEQTKEYWENPEHYKNEHLNKYPIIGFKNGKVIRGYVKGNTATPPEQPVINPNPPTKPVEPNYYRINITWDSDIDTHTIEQFFDELCIKSDRKLDDHSMSYIYTGGDEGFKILKRSLMVICSLIYPNSNVAVYGKQIKK